LVSFLVVLAGRDIPAKGRSSMFETKVLNEVYRLQKQMAALRRKYGSLCPEPLQEALRSAHKAIDTAVDTAEAAVSNRQRQDGGGGNEHGEYV
jgi:hypothetical protein